jgi:hypothetical protein
MNKCTQPTPTVNNGTTHPNQIVPVNLDNRNDTIPSVTQPDSSRVDSLDVVSTVTLS